MPAPEEHHKVKPWLKLRIDEDDKDMLMGLSRAAGSTASAEIHAFIDWTLGNTAKPPTRLVDRLK